MCELANERVPVADAREHEDLEESPAHCTTTGNELPLSFGESVDINLDLHADAHKQQQKKEGMERLCQKETD